jgi:ubiquinone/menaquinone biosynthesis C-methylase UbiE
VNNLFDVKENVKEYYGEALQNTQDLKTSACCTLDSSPQYVKDTLPLIHEEIQNKYYGCGTAFPADLDRLKILDVGCGTGRDSYIMSKIVNKDGFVYGIDMTEGQIIVANKYVEYQTDKFGYNKPNTMFIHDDMENIDKHFEPESLDLVTSNCVINLAENKSKVIQKIFDILKFGGEFYFSDIYVERRLPDHIRQNHILYGECLGGALYQKDFIRITKKSGFVNPRIMSNREIEITEPEIKELIGNAKFYSTTYRLWKIEGIEDLCEDYGHIATYLGGHPENDFIFQLDGEHIFEKNRPERICGNTALMLSQTRLSKYFQISGNFEEHFGLFQDCGTAVFRNSSDSNNTSDCGC